MKTKRKSSSNNLLPKPRYIPFHIRAIQKKNYAIPVADRLNLDKILDLIYREKYFILHARANLYRYGGCEYEWKGRGGRIKHRVVGLGLRYE